MAPQHSDLLDTVHAQEAARTVPEHIVVSAWSEHAPFAFWLAATLRPRVFVELGTHWGFSYFAFCQKFAELKTGTRCFAIDTWMGDEHASHYGEDVYQTVTQRNEHYRDFSTLLRSTFDDALDRIEDKSVDLLHIDGRHFYDDVKHDFESWVPKLSDDAIVLFHDTMVFERNFGVWKFFGELKKKHPTFEFTHCHGLGVLAIKNVPTALEKLLSANGEQSERTRADFESLGATVRRLLGSAAVAKSASRPIALSDIPDGILSPEQVAAWPLEKNEIVAAISRYEYLRRKSSSRLQKSKARLAARFMSKQHEAQLVRSSPFFDADWYRRTYSDVDQSGMEPCLHYMKFGAAEGRDPGPAFSTASYLKCNPDVVATGRNPLAHFIDLGYRQKRIVFKDPFSPFEQSDLGAIAKHISSLKNKPLISVLMPVYNPSIQHLRLAIESVINQAYPNWQLCVADDASTDPEVLKALDNYAASDRRIQVVHRPTNGNISAASNSALEIAAGEFVALLDHDDELHTTALYEVAVEINANPDVDIMYTDEDRIDETGKHSKPYYKPNFNPELQLSQNMACHLCVYRHALIDKVGGFRIGFEGSQDYDLMLRAWAATSTARIRHIPLVLYHWRNAADTASFSKTNLERCTATARRAIQEFLDQEAEGALAVPAPDMAHNTRVIRKIPTPQPMVSVIVPTRDHADLLAKCTKGVLSNTDYTNIELIIIDHSSKSPAAKTLLTKLAGDQRVRIIPYSGPFNYSAMNNLAVGQARGELICLLNDDIEIKESHWLTEMVSHAVRAEVGAVGAKLLFLDGSIQHAGVIVGLGGVAGHSLLKAKQKGPRYFGHPFLCRAMSAVTAACLVVRKSIFLEVGGLNEADLQVAFNDVDLCLKLQAAGYRNIWTPYAELVHHESASRGADDSREKKQRFLSEFAYMRKTWSDVINDDPFYNPNLRLDGPFYEPGRASRRPNSWARFTES